jgi:translocation protein SEC63
VPNSLLQFVVKARIIPPGSTNVPPPNEKDLDHMDDPEERERKGKGDDEKRVAPQVTHAPYFARDYSPRWHIFLGDSKQGKVAVPPFTFSTFDKPIFNDDGSPTYNVQTLQMQFGAPPQPGRYTFSMHVVCDSYIGFDTKMDVVMAVEDASRAEEMESEDDISEPDEGE